MTNFRVGSIKSFLPGLLCCVTIAAAAQFLSDHYGGPQMLFALLLGLAFHFLADDKACIQGLDFASSKILKIGVALLGFRITFTQISELGMSVIALVIGAVIATIFFGIVLSYILGRRARFGILTGGAVAICGASAALAIASILPKNPTRERDAIFTVVAVTTLSTTAMVLYPIIASMLGYTDKQAGIFLGATIHDVAQVVGAGYSISVESGDTATVVKLFRVALLVPIIFVFTILFAEKGEGFSISIVPFFIIGFSGAVIINSTGILPELIVTYLSELSKWFLVSGIVAIGIKTSLRSITEVGFVAIAIISLETLFVAGLVMGAISWI